jgi:hypothetical protein
MRTIGEVCDELTALEAGVAELNRLYDRAPDGSQAKQVAVANIDAAMTLRRKLEDEINAILGD